MCGTLVLLVLHVVGVFNQYQCNGERSVYVSMTVVHTEIAPPSKAKTGIKMCGVMCAETTGCKSYVYDADRLFCQLAWRHTMKASEPPSVHHRMNDTQVTSNYMSVNKYVTVLGL